MNNPLLNIPENFIENTDTNSNLLYSDTDSLYILILIPFDKNQNWRKTVDYVQTVSEMINTNYMEALNINIGKFANLNPKYNTMVFKSETVSIQAAFISKKFYTLAKIWDEGVFYEEINFKTLKKTGGQIRKADITPITKKLLEKVYTVLVVPSDIKKLEEMYRKIFIEIKNNIKMELQNDIKNLNYKSFGVPKKWGFKAEKKITQWVLGAKLYNQICEDIFRPGDSMIMIPIKGQFHDLEKVLDQKKLEFGLTKTDLKNLDNISLPPTLRADQIEILNKNFEKYKIKIDYDEVMRFNIDLKLEQYVPLFPTSIIRNSL